MSVLGQSLPKWAFRATSAFPPLATIERTPGGPVVPHADMLETQVGNYSGNPAATSNATQVAIRARVGRLSEERNSLHPR